MPEAKIASYHQPPPANRNSPVTAASSSRPAQIRASRRGCMAATVYRAMSRATPLTAWGWSQSPAAASMASTPAYTGRGQIRRTSSGAAARASTAITAPCGWPLPRVCAGTADATASSVTSTSNTQRPAVRVAGYSTGLSILMPGAS